MTSREASLASPSYLHLTCDEPVRCASCHEFWSSDQVLLTFNNPPGRGSHYPMCVRCLAPGWKDRATDCGYLTEPEPTPPLTMAMIEEVMRTL